MPRTQLRNNGLLSAICLLLLSGSILSQEKPALDVFASVPPALRPQLKERVKSFVDAYRTQQWDKLYDLLADDFNEGTKDEFVKSRLENPPQPLDVLLAFTPTRVTYRDGFDEWVIAGCSKWQTVGELSGAIYAYRRHDDWRFSTIALDLVSKPLAGGGGWSANIRDTVPCHDAQQIVGPERGERVL